MKIVNKISYDEIDDIENITPQIEIKFPILKTEEDIIKFYEEIKDEFLILLKNYYQI